MEKIRIHAFYESFLLVNFQYSLSNHSNSLTACDDDVTFSYSLSDSKIRIVDYFR